MIHTFDQQNKREAMKTYRPWFRMGNMPVCYQLLLEGQLSIKGKKILDYGCGAGEIYVKKMIEAGADAYGIDFCIEGSRDKYLGKTPYDIIVASNVLNVMNNLGDLQGLLLELVTHLSPDGMVIVNYPASPRKLNMSNKDMVCQLERLFTVTRVSKQLANNNIIFILKRIAY